CDELRTQMASRSSVALSESTHKPFGLRPHQWLMRQKAVSALVWISLPCSILNGQSLGYSVVVNYNRNIIFIVITFYI
ncbi:MAG: hypothetical protein ABFD15_03095, partial [Methanofastidiosum sp.]